MKFAKTFSVFILLGCLAVFIVSSPIYGADPKQYFDEHGNVIFDTHIDVNDGHAIVVKQGQNVKIKAELWGKDRFKYTSEKGDQDIYYELYDSSGNLVNQTNYNTDCFGSATTNWIGNAHFTLKTNTLPVNTYTLYIWFNGITKDKEALYPCSKEVLIKVIPK